MLAKILKAVGIHPTFTNNCPFAVSVVVDGNEMTLLPGQSVSGSTVLLMDVQRGGGSGEE